MSETAPDKTQSPESKASPAAKHKKRKTRHGRGGGFVKILILLLVIALAGFALWKYGLKSWHDYRARVMGLEAVVQALQEAQKRERQDVTTELESLIERQSHLEDGVSKLLEQNGNLHKDWLVAEAEYLIKLAGHRLLLEQDVRTAIVALEAANSRLGEIGDPGIIKVRKQINKDIRALRKIPLQDISGISLTLSTLAQDITRLPLRTPEPKDIQQRVKEQAAESREATNLQEFASLVWKDLKGLVVYREHDQTVQALLQPEERFFLVQNLQLKLEQARLAILQNEYQVYQERLQEAQKWIKQYFDQEHNSTRATLDTLKNLHKQEVQTDLPELTQSYRAIEQYRQGKAGKQKTQKKPAITKPEKKPEKKPETKDKQEKAKQEPPAQVSL